MAISSLVQVYNLALNAVGARDNISLPTENSREAETCGLWYSPVRDQILSSAAWPEATDMVYLAQLSEADDEWAAGEPRPGYGYSYALPTDLLRPQYLSDFGHFLVTGDQSGVRALHTNGATPILVYTKRLETIALWGSELQMAIVYGLAAHICMPLTGKPSRAKSLRDQANQLVLAARETAANMSNEFHEHVPDWIAARGYNFSASTRYVYPYGSLLSLSNVN